MSRRMLALLVASALFAIATNVVFRSGGPPARGESGPEQETSGEAAVGAPEPLARDAVSAYLASLPESEPERSPFFTRDEMLRLLSGGGAMPGDSPDADPRLDGTLYGVTRRVAWIDGRPLSEGDAVASFRVSAIDAGEVTLVRGEETLRLEVGNVPASKPALEGEEPDGQ